MRNSLENDEIKMVGNILIERREKGEGRREKREEKR